MWRASVLTIFPEMFPGPLGVSLAGKALAAKLWSLDVDRHPRPRHRQAPHRRRHAGRRRPRHGDEGGRAGRARSTRCRRRRHAPAPADEPARHAADASAGARAGARSGRGHPVRPLRGRRRAADRGARARRGLARRLSCCPAANPPRSRCSMPACGSCPASWARRPRQPRKVSPTDCSNIRNTPARRSSRAEPIPDVLLSGDHAKVADWRRGGSRTAHPRAAPGPLGRLPGPQKRQKRALTDGVTRPFRWSRSSPTHSDHCMTARRLLALPTEIEP